jgi:pilus assembly protein CpaE
MTEDRIIAVGAPPTFRHQVARALGTDPETIQWLPTVAAAEDLLTSSLEPVTVVALSAAVKDGDALGLTDFVARKSPASAVVIVRDRAPDGLLPAAMRAGARDVVDLSRGTADLEDALRRALAWSQKVRTAAGDEASDGPSHRGQIFSVFSSKGGTGKTFLACNLALALGQRSGQDVALVDLDLQVGDVFAHFGQSSTKGLDDLLAVGEHPDLETTYAAGTQLAEHVWGYGAPQDPAAENTSAGAIGKILQGLRGNFEYVIVDTGGGYADHVLAALDLSEMVCLIAGLDVVSVRHLSIAMDTLLALGLPREKFRFVLNRADSKVGLDPAEVQRVMNLKVDAMIPSSREVPTALNKGRPVLLEAPRSGVASSIYTFVDRVRSGAEARPAPAAKRRLFSKR